MCLQQMVYHPTTAVPDVPRVGQLLSHMFKAVLLVESTADQKRITTCLETSNQFS